MDNLLLINPSMQPHWSRCEPYGLLLLAAMAERCGHRVQLVDANIIETNVFEYLLQILDEFSPVWVGISAVTIQANDSYRIGRFVKAIQPTIKLIYGGIHPTFIPEEPFERGDADFVALGESFYSFDRLLAGEPPDAIPNVMFRDGKQIKCGSGESEKYDLDNLPTPAYHLVDSSKYGMKLLLEGYWDEPALDLMTSLGCPANCDFCASPAIYNRTVRFRSIKKVIDDIERILSLGIQNIHFHDDDFLLKPKQLIDLCEAIINRKLEINWVCLATVKMVLKRRHLLKHMAEAGCVGIEIGIESGDEHSLELVNAHAKKGSNNDAKLAANLIRDSGIQPIFLMIAFNLGETIESPWLSAKLVYELKHNTNIDQIPVQDTQDHLIAGHFLTISPGSALWNKRQSLSGINRATDWNHHINERVNFIPSSFLDDVPYIDHKWPLADVRSLLKEYSGNIKTWIPANFYVPESVYEEYSSIEHFLDFVCTIYNCVDNIKTVREVDNLKTNQGIDLTCSAVSILSILRLLRSKSAVTANTRMPPPIPKESIDLKIEDSSFFCPRPWTGFEVGEEDGEVRVCCWAKESYGNVNNHSIAEIWNGPRIRKIRNKMATGHWRDLCQSHCPYIAGYMEDKTPTAISKEFRDNVKLNEQEIKSRAETLKSWPRYWKIAHSTQCNLDCIMCYQDRNNKNTLPKSFYSDLKNYYQYAQELMVVGGEPFATKEIRQLLHSFPSSLYEDGRFAAITNGTIYNPSTIQLIRKVKMAWMLISIDAAKPDTYAKIRRPGKLSRVIEGIKEWKKLADEMGFPLILSFTVMRDNCGELKEFVELALAHGVDCQFFMVTGTKSQQDQINNESLRIEIERALQFIYSNGISNKMSLAENTLLSLQGIL